MKPDLEQSSVDLRELIEAFRAYADAYDCPGIAIGDGNVSGCNGPRHDTDDCPTCKVRHKVAL